MKKYDIESFLSNIESLFKEKLNSKITQINNEKADYNIELIPAGGWYLNHIPQVWDYKQFVVWGISSTALNSQQPGAALQTVTLFIECCIVDEGSSMNEAVIYQLLRYSRALLEVTNENFDGLQGYGKLQLDSLSPSLVDISGKRLRMAGVNLTASFEA